VKLPRVCAEAWLANNKQTNTPTQTLLPISICDFIALSSLFCALVDG
jgi:hypothetical protein